MKKKLEKQVLQVVEKVLSAEVRRKTDIWPPICCGIMHQPKRPAKKEEGNREKK